MILSELKAAAEAISRKHPRVQRKEGPSRDRFLRISRQTRPMPAACSPYPRTMLIASTAVESKKSVSRYTQERYNREVVEKHTAIHNVERTPIPRKKDLTCFIVVITPYLLYGKTLKNSKCRNPFYFNDLIQT
jgi:hypothetical protein